MPKRKVLYICHNHFAVRPGGAEAYALELYQAMRHSHEFEPIFLARIGSDVATKRYPHSGTRVSSINSDGNQYVFFTEPEDFDFFYLTGRDKEIYTKHFHLFLQAHRPDIIHFQHTHFLGYDLIRQVKNTLPDTPMVYTLHEYLPICRRDGQMVRTNNQELCLEASPRRCNECFPAISQQDFFLRKRFIQSHLSLIDLFMAPSRFLLERYVDWGIPRDKIRFEDYGRLPVIPNTEPEIQRPRNRFAFFGQISFFKGVQVLLKAMNRLAVDEPPTQPAAPTSASRVALPRRDDQQERHLAGHNAHLWLHGANLEVQAEGFQREFRELLDATRQNVTLVGRYDHSELPKLMANSDWVVVPSVWWENSPLVIQEAFAYGRPVICSDIGGMAEKVTHGVNGLHFRAGDPNSLAQVIHQAATTPGLWEHLRSGIPKVYAMEEHAATMTELYTDLLEHTFKGDILAHQ